TAPFHDRRIAFDPEWKAPAGRFVTADVSGHVSREKDYQSLGFNRAASVDLFQRLVTLTAGGGMSRDNVFPVGGTPAGLSTGAIIFTGKNPKNVNNVVLGVSRVLTRRW